MWNILLNNSELVLALGVAAITVIIKSILSLKMYMKISKYEQHIIDLFFWVEEKIPDNTENKSAAKLDLFLKQFIILYKRLSNGNNPDNSFINEVIKVVEQLARDKKLPEGKGN